MEEELRRSLEETAHGQRLLLALSRAAHAVQRARTPAEVYQIVGKEIARLSYHVVIFTLTDDQKHLAVSHLSFESAAVRAAEKLAGVSAEGFRLPLSPGGFLQRVITEGETIFVPSGELIAEALPGPLRLLSGRLMALLGLQQSILALLTVGGGKNGLLVVNGTNLTEADVPAVTAFANQAAIAIENARSYEEAQKELAKRKQAEAALKEYSEQLEEMVEKRTQQLRDAHERLIRREKLAVMGQMAGSVSHELRNPLGTISNAVYYLKMVLSDADETTKEYLEMIAEEVRNSNRIITDLLDFSRTRIPDRERVAVSKLAAEVLEKRPPPENVEAAAKMAADLPPVYVDGHQIKQVLGNLVANAYQAMKEGGGLTISAQVEEGQVALSVTDTGVGIPPENMVRLFKPLFTTKARGIGLGLAVAKMLVEANEGSIEATSEVGKGSTFTVRLPTKETGS